jgi:hypothetical protein
LVNHSLDEGDQVSDFSPAPLREEWVLFQPFYFNLYLLDELLQEYVSELLASENRKFAFAQAPYGGGPRHIIY